MEVYTVLKDRSKTLRWSDGYRFLRDASLGLVILHEHELVHRDLKSANVLLDADGRAKLCDFGFSTLRSEATSDVGTRIWNAPEVLKENLRRLQVTYLVLQ